jgi:hypothetical protein
LDIRAIFKEISEQLISEFRKTSQIKHPGGKGDTREDAFRDFLKAYLPARYAVGKGEVITPENRHSPELDIVIHDPHHCPALIRSLSQSIYPVESVFGVISVKSTLSSNNLREAYRNISSLKSILPATGFTHYASPGSSIGLGPPIPVTGVVAYDCDRSLEAVARQVEELDAECADIQLRPDFVAVIGQGIVAPRTPLRGEFNSFQLPGDRTALVDLRKTGRHTLFRLYIEILRELNSLILQPLDLSLYDQMPGLIGPYRVGGKTRLVSVKLDGSNQRRTVQLNESAISEIVTNSKSVTVREHYLNVIGEIPIGIEQSGVNLGAIIHEYNPKNRPPILSVPIQASANGSASPPVFQLLQLTIDGKDYAVDISALDETYFDNDLDFTVEELLSS